MLAEKIPQNIKKFRELRNYTREDMASFLEMSTSGYAKIEQGNVDLSIRKLEQIADILKVEIRQIMDFEVSQVFNICDNTITDSNAVVGCSSNRDLQNLFKTPEYLKKLINSLERENKLLRDQLEKQ